MEGDAKLSYRIVVIATDFFRHFIEDTLRKNVPEQEYLFAEYHTFHEVTDIYLKYEDQADGFITSGYIVQYVIERSVNHPCKPILSFGIGEGDFHLLLLNLFLNDRSLDPGRVIMDTHLTVMPGFSIEDYLSREDIRADNRVFMSSLDKKTLPELCDIEKYTARQILRLWENGRIDMVVCRYSSLMPVLQKFRIPCVFANPSEGHFMEIYRSLVSKLELEKLRGSLPAFVLVSRQKRHGDPAADSEDEAIRGCMEDFSRGGMMDLDIIRCAPAGCGFSTTQRMVKYMTARFETCTLKNYLDQNLGFEAVVAYGIGLNQEKAYEHAHLALKEAARTGKSFIIDENENGIGPLNSDKVYSISYRDEPLLDRAAAACGLSRLTMHRLSAALHYDGTDEMSAQVLAAKMNSTVRNASRILNALEESGFAEASLKKVEKKKGRPEKIYRINLLPEVKDNRNTR